MKNKTDNQKNFLKKLLIKIIRKLGYEVIDQANLNLRQLGYAGIL